MSVTSDIRAYAAENPGAKPSAIAVACGCKPEYVRVVLRQRNGARSEADRRYHATAKGKATTAANVAAIYARRKALKETSDQRAVNRAQREAYREAKLAGLTRYQAAARAWSARARMIRQTGNAIAATEAGQLARQEVRRQHKDKTDVASSN